MLFLVLPIRVLKKLMQDTASLVEEVEKTQVVAKPKPVHKVKEYKYKAPKKNEFTVEKVGEHEFVVKGESLERLVEMTNLDHHDGVVRLARKLMHLGIDEALRKKKEPLMVMMWQLVILILNLCNNFREV